MIYKLLNEIVIPSSKKQNSRLLMVEKSEINESSLDYLLIETASLHINDEAKLEQIGCNIGSRLIEM
jgi:hypothetical protein